MWNKPESLAEAKQYVGRRVVKQFDAGSFTGVVQEVLEEYQTEDGAVVHIQNQEFLYHIKYEDSDEEDMEFTELAACLSSPAQPEKGKRRQSAGTMPKSQQKRKPANEQPAQGAQSDSPPTNAIAHEGEQVQPSNKRVKTIAAQQPPRRMLGELNTNTLNQGPGTQGDATNANKQPGKDAQRAQHTQHARPAGQGTQQEPAPMAVDEAEKDENDITACRSRGLAGHLKNIKLQDFMCHEHFTMDFGPHVTVVSGTNGSGKSAIMQGLQACLGVSARETGRSKSLGSFVREGTDVAIVQVTLWNEGADAYMPHVFGKEIVIERRVRRAGGGDFKLFGEHRMARNVAISTKKEDVYALLDHFSINAANPLTIITQDMARTFLHGSANSSRFRYDMYMEGTMLAEIKEHISKSNDSITQAWQNVKATEQAHELRAAEVKRLQQELDRLHDVMQSRELAVKMGKVAVWRFYQDACKTTQIQHAVHRNTQQKLQEIASAMPALEETLEQCRASTQAKKWDLDRLKEETLRLTTVLRQLQEQLRAKMAASRDAEQRRLGTQAELEALQQEKSGLEGELNRVASSLKSNEQIEEVRRKLAELEEQTSKLMADDREQDQRFHAKREAKREADDAVQTLQQQLHGLHKDANGLQNEINNFQGQLRTIQTSANSKVAQFGGDRMVQLVNLLQQPQNRRRFKKLPVGPIGAYLGLTETRWSRAVGTLLNSQLERFLCSCMEDSKQLTSLAQQVGVRVNTSVVTTFGLPRHQVQRRYDTARNTSVLDVLSIMHPDAAASDVLFNALVDTSRVDTVLLLDSSPACKQMMYQPGFGTTGLSLMDPDGRKYTNINGTNKISPPPYRTFDRIGMDTTEQIRQLQEMLAERGTELQKVQQNIRQVNQQVAEKQAVGAALHKESADIQLVKAQLRRRIQGLQQQSSAMTPALSQHMGEEEAQMQEATQLIMQTQVGIADHQMTLREREQECQALQQEVQQLRAELDSKRQGTGADIVKINAEIEQLSKQEVAAAHSLKQLQAEQKNQQEQLQNTEAKIQKYQEGEKDAFEMAEAEWGGESHEEMEEKASQAEQEIRHYFAQRFLSDPKARRPTRKPGQQGQAGPSQAQGTQAGTENSELEQYLDAVMGAEALMKEEERLENLAKEACKQAGGDEREVQMELEKIRNLYDKEHAKLAVTKAQVKQLAKCCQARLNSFCNLRQNIADTSHQHFNKYMLRRLHMGELKVDYEGCELSLRVKVKGKEDPKAQWVSDLKQLSGGERSYTAVALLLALGQWSEAPFRCLDEYDVFMDAINRRIATETLLSFALEMKDRQYILLTPQDLAAIQDANKQLQEKLSAQLGVPTQLPASFLHMVHVKPARPTQQH